MSDKKKLQKVTMTNLTTGIKNISYYDPNSKPLALENIIEKIRFNPFGNSELYNLTKVFNNIYSPFNRLYSTLENVNAPYREMKNNIWEMVRPFKVWENQKSILGIVAGMRLNIFESFANSPFIELKKDIAEVYKYIEQNEPEKDTPINAGKAREILINKEIVKCSNMVLGLCMAIGKLYYTEQINDVLEKLNIESNPNLIREMQKCRNAANKRLKALFNKDPKKKPLSDAKINSLYRQLQTAQTIFRSLDLKGKRHLQNYIREIKRQRTPDF